MPVPVPVPLPGLELGAAELDEVLVPEGTLLDPGAEGIPAVEDPGAAMDDEPDAPQYVPGKLLEEALTPDDGEGPLDRAPVPCDEVPPVGTLCP